MVFADNVQRRPEDLRMTWPTDRLGAAGERRVNSRDGLALFRVLLMGELRKGVPTRSNRC